MKNSYYFKRNATRTFLLVTNFDAGHPEDVSFANCDLFRRSFSNMGLSFSFNTEKFWNIYQPTEFNKLFEKVMKPNTDREIKFPDSSGPDYRLRLLLNSKQINPIRRGVRNM